MGQLRDKRRKIERRKLRVRSGLRNARYMRLSVFRSLNNISGQIIDDAKGHTVVSCSSRELSNVSGDKKAIAQEVGKKLAEKAKEHGIERVVFDRGQYLYHGRVKAFADGLRDGGLLV